MKKTYINPEFEMDIITIEDAILASVGAGSESMGADSGMGGINQTVFPF